MRVRVMMALALFLTGCAALPHRQIKGPLISSPMPHLSLKEAQSAYRAFEYERCLSILEKQLISIPPTTPGYTDALTYAGASAYMLGDDAKAGQYFMQIHVLDPAYRIDEDEFSPQIVSLFKARIPI